MGFASTLKSIFRTKKKESVPSEEYSQFIEFPTQKIIETRIKPIKIPTLLDLGGKLEIILNSVQDIKHEMVSKAWLRAEYDEGRKIVEKLDNIDQKLNSLLNVMNKFVVNLSVTEKEKSEEKTHGLHPTEKILSIISQKERINFSDLRNLVDISNPTLSKYLKQLLEKNKIEKEKEGRFIYYSVPNPLTHSKRTY